MRLMLILVIFLIVGGYMIAKINSLDLSKPEDRESFMGKFWLWLKEVGKSTANVVGYAAKQEWLPKNETNNSVAK